MDKIKIILDTDLGADCGDAAALALLSYFERIGKGQVLAVTHTVGQTELRGAYIANIFISCFKFVSRIERNL